MDTLKDKFFTDFLLMRFLLEAIIDNTSALNVFKMTSVNVELCSHLNPEKPVISFMVMVRFIRSPVAITSRETLDDVRCLRVRKEAGEREIWPPVKFVKWGSISPA